MVSCIEHNGRRTTLPNHPGDMPEGTMNTWVNLMEEPRMTYTAAVKQTLEGWIGWVEEIPGVNCQEPTYDALMETMTETLREAIELNKA